MKITTIVLTLSTLCTAALGCGSEGSGSAPAATGTSTAAAAPAGTTAAATAAAATPPPEGAVLVSKIQEDFKADEKKWTGQKVKVYGVYMNTNTMKSGNNTTYNIVVIDEKGKSSPSISCAVAAEPKDLRQYDPVVVEGTIEKMFGASLKDCTYTKR